MTILDTWSIKINRQPKVAALNKTFFSFGLPGFDFLKNLLKIRVYSAILLANGFTFDAVAGIRFYFQAGFANHFIAILTDAEIFGIKPLKRVFD